jgi:hypothetical protein
LKRPVKANERKPFRIITIICENFKQILKNCAAKKKPLLYMTRYHKLNDNGRL